MSQINFEKGGGLVPAIVQEVETQEVLMLGYMNKKALEKTQADGYVCFWSRSKNKLWVKGEESGNKLKVEEIFLDCDQDTILIKAKLMGTAACHTGNKTCFFDKLKK